MKVEEKNLNKKIQELYVKREKLQYRYQSAMIEANNQNSLVRSYSTADRIKSELERIVEELKFTEKKLRTLK